MLGRQTIACITSSQYLVKETNKTNHNEKAQNHWIKQDQYHNEKIPNPLTKNDQYHNKKKSQNL